MFGLLTDFNHPQALAIYRVYDNISAVASMVATTNFESGDTAMPYVPLPAGMVSMTFFYFDILFSTYTKPGFIKHVKKRFLFFRNKEMKKMLICSLFSRLHYSDFSKGLIYTITSERPGADRVSPSGVYLYEVMP